MNTRDVDLLIVGAGPCGLGATTQLEELNEIGASVPSYLLVDSGSNTGGCASSVTTPEGFTFDFGGHVLFPHRHYAGFVRMLNTVVDKWHFSTPIRGVWVDGRLIPHPIQRNIQRLRLRKSIPCLIGLLRLKTERTFRSHAGTSDFNLGQPLSTYLRGRFGKEMTNLILGPLNEKMWACSAEDLESSWAQHRSGSNSPNVPDVSIWKLLWNLLLRVDDPGWSQSSSVAYPLRGGTGIIWTRLAERIPANRLVLGTRLTEIVSESHMAHFTDGMSVRYGALVSSIPLDILLRSISDRSDLSALAGRLVSSRAHLLGLGIRGPVPELLVGVHSFHVPQPNVPFWRLTFPAAFSPMNVPDPPEHWSVLCEASERRSVTSTNSGPNQLAASMENALHTLGLLRGSCRVVSRWYAHLEHGYPTPFRGRDSLLPAIQDELTKIDIFSRGRFGGWRYEISNQDHSFMQGVEVVNRLVLGDPETTYVWSKS